MLRRDVMSTFATDYGFPQFMRESTVPLWALYSDAIFDFDGHKLYSQ